MLARAGGAHSNKLLHTNAPLSQARRE